MSSLDFLFLIVLGIGLVMGIIKGAIMQMATLVGIVLGIYLAYLFYKPFAAILVNSFHFSNQVAVPVAFLILFVAGGIGLYIVGWLLAKIFKAASLSWFDRLAGGVLGMLKMALVLGIFLNLYTSAHDKITGKETEKSSHSMLYNSIKELPNMILPLIDFHKWQHPDENK